MTRLSWTSQAKSSEQNRLYVFEIMVGPCRLGLQTSTVSRYSYQSLTSIATESKRVVCRRFGPQMDLTPRLDLSDLGSTLPRPCRDLTGIGFTRAFARDRLGLLMCV